MLTFICVKSTCTAPAVAQLAGAPAPHAGDPGSIPAPWSFPDSTPILSPTHFLSFSLVSCPIKGIKSPKNNLKKKKKNSCICANQNQIQSSDNLPMFSLTQLVIPVLCHLS